MPSLKDRSGAFSLGNVQITCPEWGRSVHAYQWLLERKPLFNACIKKKERVQVMSLRYRKKKTTCYEKFQVRMCLKICGVCAWTETSSAGNVMRWVEWEHCTGLSPCFWERKKKKKKYTVGLSLWFNATARSRPLRKLPKSQFKPSEMAKCLPSGIIEFGA